MATETTEVMTLREHQAAAGRALKGKPKSAAHRAKLRAILAEARARKLKPRQ